MVQVLDLPSELIAAIFQHLDDADFFTARLVSKALETASLTLFGRRFFRKKGYMITTPSLDVLSNVAHSPKISKYIQHIWFNPDCYTFIHPQCAPETDIECDDAEDESEGERIEIIERLDLLSPDDQRRWNAYLDVTRDHRELLASGAEALERRLIEILAAVPNVKILGMRRSEDHSPWGWRSLQDAVGEDPRILGPIPSQALDGLSAPTRLFRAMIAAVSKTHTSLQRLYTDAVEVDNIRTQSLRESGLQTAMQSMLYLEINVSKAWLPATPDPEWRVLHDESKYGDGLLRVFQAAAPTLLELGLQIFPELRRAHWPYGATHYGADVWKQRSYQYLTFEKIVENVTFERLTRLKLEKVATTPGLLTKFLNPSTTQLTSLKMRDIRLLSDDDHARPWETIFSFLHSSAPNLSYLLLYQLLYTHGGISFVEKPPRPSSAVVNVHSADPSAPQPLVDTQDAGHFAYVYGDMHSPEARGGGGTFREYEHITLEAKSREEVVAKLAQVRERHWYCGNVYSYAMDEEIWHTDTSDEEW